MRTKAASASVALLVATLTACGGSEPPPANPPAIPETAPTSAPAPVATAPAPTTTASAAPPADPAPAASATPAAAPTASAAAAPAAAAAEIEGTLKNRKGKELVLRFDGTDLPAAGSKATLSKYFEGKPGQASPLGALGGLLGGTITGWMVIADVTVKGVNGKDVTVTIDGEKSNIVVNGKPVNQFTPGAKVKLAPAQ